VTGFIIYLQQINAFEIQQPLGQQAGAAAADSWYTVLTTAAAPTCVEGHPQQQT
jgi:hypothetical protein